MNPTQCRCSCGATRFDVTAAPLFRVLCHCTICQRFNDAPFADVVVCRADDVELPPEGAVNFGTYRPPPNVERGRCASCKQPAVEVFAAPLLPKLVMIPAGMFPSGAELPSPAAHIFYDKRVSDADDTHPKYRGYLRSQLAFLKHWWSGRRS